MGVLSDLIAGTSPVNYKDYNAPLTQASQVFYNESLKNPFSYQYNPYKAADGTTQYTDQFTVKDPNGGAANVLAPKGYTLRDYNVANGNIIDPNTWMNNTTTGTVGGSGGTKVVDPPYQPTAVETNTLYDAAVRNAYADQGRGPGSANPMQDAGYQYWMNALQKGDITVDQLGKAFAADVAQRNAVSGANQPSPVNSGGNDVVGPGNTALSPAQIAANNSVNTIFQKALGRDATPEGLKYWADAARANNWTPAQLEEAIINGAKANGEYKPPVTTTTADPNEIFRPDLYPTSNSFNGIDFNNDFVKSVMPMLQDYITKMPENIDKWTQGARDSAEATARTQVQDRMPGVLNNLATRNMLNSTTGADAIRRMLSEVANTASQNTYTAGMEAAKLKANIPTTLAQLLELGKVSASESKQPNAPYDSLMSFLLGSM